MIVRLIAFLWRNFLLLFVRHSKVKIVYKSGHVEYFLASKWKVSTSTDGDRLLSLSITFPKGHHKRSLALNVADIESIVEIY